MKTTATKIASLLLVLVMVASLAACAPTDPWESAAYTTDTALGEGPTAFLLEVVVGEHKVTFTINTDQEILADALLGLELISGEYGPYGIYIKKVNGITADYNVNAAYWALYINGASASDSASSITIEDGATYTLTYTK